MFLTRTWSPYFQSAARMRGRAYQNAGRVRPLMPQDDELVRALVRGSRDYTVTLSRVGTSAQATCTCTYFESGHLCKHIWATLLDLQLDSARWRHPQAAAVAGGVSQTAAGDAGEGVGEGSGEVPPQGQAIPIERLENAPPQLPKARRRSDGHGHGPAPARHAEPPWMGRLTLLRPPSYLAGQHDRLPPLPEQRQVCYVVMPQLCVRHGGVVVELRERRGTADGFSKPRRLRVSCDNLRELPDPVDRELCALLLGATAVDLIDSGYGLGGRGDRSQSTFRLPSGATRAMLRRMIDTGRCLLCVDEENDILADAPLRFEDDLEGQGASTAAAAGESGESGGHAGNGHDREPQAWELWVVGRTTAAAEPTRAQGHDESLDADVSDGDARDALETEAEAEASEASEAVIGELHVTLELRRGHRRMDIAQPRLLLGGVEGVVIHGTTAAYLDDHGAERWVAQFREELRRDEEVKPIVVPAADVPRFLDRLYLLPQLPQIDLPQGLGRVARRVTARPAIELYPGESFRGIVGLPRNTLVARVLFQYEEHRVRLGQPGRFVATASQASHTEAVVAQPLTPPAESALSPDIDIDIDTETESEEASKLTQLNELDGAEDSQAVVEAEAPPAEGDLILRDSAAEHQAGVLLAQLGFRALNGSGSVFGGAGASGGASGSGGVSGGGGDQTLLQLPARLMPAAVRTLLQRGWGVAVEQRSLAAPSTPSLSIASGVDWFELRGQVAYQTQHGVQYVGLPDILAAARTGKNLIQLADGSQGLIPEQWLEDNRLLTTLGKLQGDHLRFRISQTAMLDALLGRAGMVDVDAQFAQARQRLDEFDGIHPLEAADTFHGTLRPYQKHGLGWLRFLRWFGMGGVLADDMGLGKTVQVLAMLDALRTGVQGSGSGVREDIGTNESSRELSSNSISNPQSAISNSTTPHPNSLPALIVAPRSVVFNWLDEAVRFSPKLRVANYTGGDRHALREAFTEHDVIVTSYGLMRRDIDELRQHEFSYVVLDEAQAIKNPASQSAKAARLLNAHHRLALTGTPVENHLGDLWSIFEYLNPGMLGSATRFGDMVRSATSPRNGQGQHHGQHDLSLAAQVGKALRPFILRRTKQQVLSDLPDKTEQTLVCEMEDAQRAVYDELRLYYRSTLLSNGTTATPGSASVFGGLGSSGRASSGGGGSGGGASGGSGSGGVMVLEALLRLRQAACHPGLIDPARSHEPSAKLEVLLDRLTDLIDEGHKALVFSQFTSLLAIVRQRLDERGIVYAYLDGQTRDRRAVVERFQTDPACPVFLVSLKAGGLGLNLTAAEYVFILDPWWNPAVEQQAIDRTHRIGQTRHVFAYRLICENTVEQRIAELQQRKRDLAQAIIGSEQSLLQSLTREDLDRLLS
jgi:superfamily II DNA or RNA helicase